MNDSMETKDPVKETKAVRHPIKTVLIVLKIAIITLLLSAAMYEGYYQYQGYKHRKAVGNVITASTYLDRGYYWTYPEEKLFSNYNEDGEKIEFKSDKLGFRNAKVQEEYDILLLGDSFISAANTKEEGTFAQQLRSQGYQVYNAGIDGTGTIHQAYILRDLLKTIKPKLVVLNFYLGNDFRDNFFCAELPNLPVPETKGQINKPDADTKVATTTATKVETSTVTTPTSVANNEPRLSWSEGLRQIKGKSLNILNHSGLFQIVYQKFYLPKQLDNDLGYYDRCELKVMAYNDKNKDPDIEKALVKTEQALKYMKDLLAQRNIPLLVVAIPSKAQVLKSVREISNFAEDKGGPGYFQSIKMHVDFDGPDKLLSSLCGKLQIPQVSLLRAFRKNYEQKLYYHLDAHWTAKGQALAAGQSAEMVKKLLRGEDKSTFYAANRAEPRKSRFKSSVRPNVKSNARSRVRRRAGARYAYRYAAPSYPPVAPMYYAPVPPPPMISVPYNPYPVPYVRGLGMRICVD
jgi:hypothetical protein